MKIRGLVWILVCAFLLVTETAVKAAEKDDNWNWAIATDYGFHLRLPFQLKAVHRDEAMTNKKEPLIWQRLDQNGNPIYSMVLHYLDQPNTITPVELINSVFDERTSQEKPGQKLAMGVLERTVEKDRGLLQVYECNDTECWVQQTLMSIRSNRGVVIILSARVEKFLDHSIIDEWKIIAQNMRWLP